MDTPLLASTGVSRVGWTSSRSMKRWLQRSFSLSDQKLQESTNNNSVWKVESCTIVRILIEKSGNTNATILQRGIDEKRQIGLSRAYGQPDMVWYKDVSSHSIDKFILFPTLSIYIREDSPWESKAMEQDCLNHDYRKKWSAKWALIRLLTPWQNHFRYQIDMRWNISELKWIKVENTLS